MIFSHSWAVAFVPVLMWLADLACSVMIILITSTLHTDTLISQQKLLKPFLYSFFAVTIALNFLTTGALPSSPPRGAFVADGAPQGLLCGKSER